MIFENQFHLSFSSKLFQIFVPSESSFSYHIFLPKCRASMSTEIKPKISWSCVMSFFKMLNLSFLVSETIADSFLLCFSFNSHFLHQQRFHFLNVYRSASSPGTSHFIIQSTAELRAHRFSTSSGFQINVQSLIVSFDNHLEAQIFNSSRDRGSRESLFVHTFIIYTRLLSGSRVLPMISFLLDERLN